MSVGTAAKPETRSVRDRLIEAAEQCLTAKGIRATTVSEVAEVAGVSRGWLYRHFPDKAELLGAAQILEKTWGRLFPPDQPESLYMALRSRNAAICSSE